jgi:hypothetical protein
LADLGTRSIGDTTGSLPWNRMTPEPQAVSPGVDQVPYILMLNTVENRIEIPDGMDILMWGAASSAAIRSIQTEHISADNAAIYGPLTLNSSLQWGGALDDPFIDLPVGYTALISLLNAEFINGRNEAFLRNASNLNAGTLPDTRFPAVLPAISGANLTNLNASNVTSGSLAKARQHASTAYIDAVQEWTATQFIRGNVGTSDCLAVKVNGEATYRAIIEAAGHYTIGDGTNPPDARMRRSGVKTITFDDNAAGVMTLAVTGALSTTTGLTVGTTLTLSGIATSATVGAAGGAAALPATPLGYITVTIGATARKIPYYNA